MSLRLTTDRSIRLHALAIFVLGSVTQLARADDLALHSQLSRAAIQLASLCSKVDAYEEEHGALPKTLVDAGGANIDADPWGHPYVYESRPELPEGYAVSSWGPDGKPHTADDVHPDPPHSWDDAKHTKAENAMHAFRHAGAACDAFIRRGTTVAPKFDAECRRTFAALQEAAAVEYRTACQKSAHVEAAPPFVKAEWQHRVDAVCNATSYDAYLEANRAAAAFWSKNKEKIRKYQEEQENTPEKKIERATRLAHDLGRNIMRFRTDTGCMDYKCLSTFGNMTVKTASQLVGCPADVVALKLCGEVEPGYVCYGGPYQEKVERDPWGHEWQLLHGHPSDYPTVKSAGPDGKMNTADDISVIF